MSAVPQAITAPTHAHRWGPCIVKWLGLSRLKYCQVAGCAATIRC